MSDKFVPICVVFSAKTSANQTQDLMDGRLDKRRKGIFGPPISKYAVFFIDDFNMPALEEYGAQPPIELIRQWMDHDGWYDRKAIGTFRTLVDIGFVCAMGPPGGGRNPVTARLTRHFNYLSFVEMSDPSKARIFGTIMESWLPESLLEFKDTIVQVGFQAQILLDDESEHQFENLKSQLSTYILQSAMSCFQPPQNLTILSTYEIWQRCSRVS